MVNRGDKRVRRRAIHARLRGKLAGTAERPRLCFYKSSTHVYVQLIDDEKGHTLGSISTVSKSQRGKLPRQGNVAAAKAVGEAIAELALSKNIDKVVFDRGGFLYHGAVKALAEAARAKGLKF